MLTNLALDRGESIRIGGRCHRIHHIASDLGLGSGLDLLFALARGGDGHDSRDHIFRHALWWWSSSLCLLLLRLVVAVAVAVVVVMVVWAVRVRV